MNVEKNDASAEKPTPLGHSSRFGLPSFGSVLQDIRFTSRTLRRNPGFTLLAVLILALGIGANTAIFSLLSAVALRPLPFKAPDRLVVLWDDFTLPGGPAHVEPAPANYVDWKTRAQSFEGMAAMEKVTYNLTGGGEPQKLAGVRTTANLFSLLGMQPLLGRTFLPDDEGPDASPVVVVSRSLWLRRFGGNPDIVGRTIVLDGLKRTVIGVVPDDFEFPSKDAVVWVPAAFTPQELAPRNSYFWYVIARLKSGVSLGQAQTEMTSIAKIVQQEYGAGTGPGVSIVPLHKQLAHGVRPELFILLTAVAMILAITCANVANLLLARGASRRKELALRQALGAGRGRMLRQLFTESAVLAGLGLVVGVALSTATFGYLTRLIPGILPHGTSPGLDWRVLAFTVGITVLTVLLFGAGPAYAATRLGFGESLKKGGVGRSSTRGGARMRNALVVAEITLTAVLLIGAGLLLHSYIAVLNVNPGFRPQHLLLAETDLSPSKYADLTSRREFYERVLARVKALPGVVSAGYANYPPLVFNGGRAVVTIEGQPAPRPRDLLARNMASDRAVSAGYFSALGVPLLRGRYFDERDGAKSAPAVLINQTMAQRHWRGENPVGKRFKMGASKSDSPWLTVIGVVGDVRQMSLDAPVEPAFYLALSQTSTDGPFFWPQYLLVRTQSDPMSLATAVRNAVWAVDPDQPVSNIRPMTQVFDQQLSSRNTQLTLVGGLAVLALLLAAVGLYGVLSYTVAQRTSEIGLRVALGAQQSNVVGAVVRSALLLAALGIAAGLAAAFGLSRLLASFLFGIAPTDPATFVAVPVLLVLVTIVASYVPARRAASVDPVSALRVE